MVNVGNNMGMKRPCPLCKDDSEPSEQFLDSQEHLIICKRIKRHVPEVRENNVIKHDDIFSDDIRKQKAAVELFQKAVNVRKRLLAA